MSGSFDVLACRRSGSREGRPLEVGGPCVCLCTHPRTRVCDQQSCHCLTLSCLEGLTLSPNQSIITISLCQQCGLPTVALPPPFSRSSPLSLSDHHLDTEATPSLWAWHLRTWSLPRNLRATLNLQWF